MSIIERCVIAGHEMDLASNYEETGAGFGKDGTMFEEYFREVAVISEDKAFFENIFGYKRNWPDLSGEQKMSLSSGRTLLFTLKTSKSSSSIFMYKKKKGKDHGSLLFMAELKPEFLLGINPNHDEPFGMIGVSIAEKDRLIFTTFPRGEVDVLISKLQGGRMREHLFSGRLGSDYLMSCTPVFLKSRFDGPLWSLVLSEPTSAVFNPVRSFKISFILILSLALVVVILLSTWQIRRYLVPLDRLEKGTMEISRGDFASRVIIKSGDEFEDLAQSFNSMIDRIDQQFRTLNTMSDIDRAILSELDFEKIIDTFINRIGDVCPCDAAGVCFRYGNSDERWITHYRTLPPHGEKSPPEVYNLDNNDLAMLYDRPVCLVEVQGGHPPRYLSPLIQSGFTRFLAVPVTLNTHMMAIVFLGGKGRDFHEEEYQVRARQIADRMAVALSNAYLIDELNDLNWGTLTALARVVDAKSPWTAGHSERVAALALRIGEAIGLSQFQLDILHKAGMLHDIGKVSTPRAILDKKGKLTNEEYAVIQEHPERGARILEPISPYAEMIPIVLQHHERFDGRGYPRRLAEHDICLGARIMAVADTFDAMTSDRPYRAGMDASVAIEEIRKEAGRQFDPEVVKAFSQIMSDHKTMKECA
jgi:putative nucleotidyltransferase with HDIG domain